MVLRSEESYDKKLWVMQQVSPSILVRNLCAHNSRSNGGIACGIHNVNLIPFLNRKNKCRTPESSRTQGLVAKPKGYTK